MKMSKAKFLLLVALLAAPMMADITINTDAYAAKNKICYQMFDFYDGYSIKNYFHFDQANSNVVKISVNRKSNLKFTYKYELNPTKISINYLYKYADGLFNLVSEEDIQQTHYIEAYNMGIPDEKGEIVNCRLGKLIALD